MSRHREYEEAFKAEHCTPIRAWRRLGIPELKPYDWQRTWARPEAQPQWVQDRIRKARNQAAALIAAEQAREA